MPDVAVHAAFGRDVFSSLSPEIRQVIRPQPWTFGLFGPDLWFMYKPWRRREGRGRRMHTTRPGAFLTGLLKRSAASSHREELFSWLAGFFCHYALDSTTHPYIIYVTTEEYHYPRCHMSFEHFRHLMTARGVADDTLDTIERCGIDLHHWLEGFKDTPTSVRRTVETIKTHPLVPRDIVVRGFIIDSETGGLSEVEQYDDTRVS